MTAAILQFQPIQQQQQKDQSDYTNFTMTREYHHIMVGMLNKEHPFKAIRLATEFNKENGFELIDISNIKRWKMKLQKMKS